MEEFAIGVWIVVGLLMCPWLGIQIVKDFLKGIG